MGPHEREALERERRELLRTYFKTQLEGRRLDEIEKLLGAPSILGMPVHVDPALPDDVVQIRDGSGKVLGEITNIGDSPSGFTRKDQT